MNTERFIAARLSSGGGASFTRPVVRIGIASIALGLALMILSVAIVKGFQADIREKIIGIKGHIQINLFSSNTLVEKKPVQANRDFIEVLRKSRGIKHVQVYAEKAGIIKVEDATEGSILRGAGKDFDWSYVNNSLVEGRCPEVGDSIPSDEVVVSRWLTNRLNLALGDKLIMYFIEKQPRPRVFRISGIYETAMEEEIDKQFLFGDIGHIQRINGWNQNEVDGFEVFIDDFRDLENMKQLVYQTSDYDLNVTSIDEEYPQIFDWLNLLDINVIIILFMMILVAGVNMISTLLILVLERTQMVGILKSLGATDFSIRKVFVYLSGGILWKGLLIGNILAIGLALLQYRFHFIPLDPQSYYMTTVPIQLNLVEILMLNIGSVIVLGLMTLIPLIVIGRMSPSKTLRFD